MDNKNLVDCECGRPYRKCYIASHLKSNEHKYFIENGKKFSEPMYKQCDDNKVICECKKIIVNRKYNKILHEKTIYHTKYMECPSGGSYNYLLSKYENNGNEKYIVIYKK